jgi:catechol 2,3-dioxygenase-like lactoylglutathione lyase family enzyme
MTEQEDLRQARYYGANVIFDHIVLTVTDTEKSKQFYAGTLAPLGIEFIKEEDGCVGFGTNGKASFWLCSDNEAQAPMHIAFVAPNRESINAFHEAALSMGGRDNGKPGLRQHYQPNYYGAYVLDPDGHNIEAVCRKTV